MLTLPRSVCAALAVVTLALAACGDDADTGNPGPGDPQAPEETGPGPGSGDEDNTFDHPGVAPDVWDLLDRMQEQGPPAFQARVHGCAKMRYATLGRVLASRGVNLGANGGLSAGRMWRTSDQSLGAANYDARVRENLELTTASASKMFDIFIQAAPEIIAAMPTLAACTVGGKPATMFNEFDQCTPDGVACLIGMPATGSHLELCNQTIARASSPDKGKLIAVAALMAAAHTCE